MTQDTPWQDAEKTIDIHGIGYVVKEFEHTGKHTLAYSGPAIRFFAELERQLLAGEKS